MTTVLIVDDDHACLEYFRILATRRGQDVVVARNGEEGLQLAATHRPEVVVSDILMPELDGFEFARRLWRLGLHPRIIFCSGNLLGSEVEAVARRVGARELLQKPVDPDVFVRALDAACEAVDPSPPMFPAGAAVEAQLRALNEGLIARIRENDDLRLEIAELRARLRDLGGEQQPMPFAARADTSARVAPRAAAGAMAETSRQPK